MGEPRLKATIMDGQAMERAAVRIAHEIIERNEGAASIGGVIGIIRRGEFLAERLVSEIEKIEGVRPPLGSRDISVYRDDVQRHIQPVLHATNIPFDIDGANIILVDDVLYTGRSVRAAMQAILDLGRPAAIRLCVLVDRGHRELPIAPDCVGLTVETAQNQEVRVMIEPIDSENSVYLVEVEA